MFRGADSSYMVQDDQVPFYNLGVRRILHMIPAPFPGVWHTLEDNRDALDLDVMEKIGSWLRVFVYSYLNAS